ncbi:MAG TPA: ornithine cyclodeaminase [Crenotrichaceae bacterium]|nr:ornithine cyclodeaminase [Crenotrichaceae bacterium]
MKILTVNDIVHLIQLVGLNHFFDIVIKALHSDFKRWSDFQLSPRHAVHFKDGVIELMPCADNDFYTFKYVNGHPQNPQFDKLCVVAIGQISDCRTGYPLLLSEMTLLTAVRTAAVGALVAQYLSRAKVESLAMIGTGTQAEFQVIAFHHVFPFQTLYYYDIDPFAMQKFSYNLASMPFQIIPCRSIIEAVVNSDIVITATAAKARQKLFSIEDIQPGTHIHAMGGDCPGKTEFSAELVRQCKVVVEYIPQSIEEGELQQCMDYAIHAEVWELVCGIKPGRVDNQEITLFDSVGFALEDYSILRVVDQLARQYQLGTEFHMLPELADPKNLFVLLN